MVKSNCFVSTHHLTLSLTSLSKRLPAKTNCKLKMPLLGVIQMRNLQKTMMKRRLQVTMP